MPNTMKWLALTFVGVIASPVLAQMAPTGEHYAGRASDTGYGGTFVNVTGTFAATIPLDLPPARGGLPIPLQAIYGARGVGAAGVGWDMPLSYIQQDQTYAHRRPAYAAYGPPGPRKRMSLSLLGGGGELVPNGDAWVLRHGTLDLTVRHSADGAFLAYDGVGRIFKFVRPTAFGTEGLWLLKAVSAAGGAKVELFYQINSWPLQGDGPNPNIPGSVGLEVNLSRITYNSTAFTGCAKNEIVLTYLGGSGSTSPMALSMLGNTPMVRFHTLTQIDVESRATCATPLQSLRRYELLYIPSSDTGLPRLQTVRMFGRKGLLDVEETPPLPVVSYEYGNPGTASGSQVIDLPPDDGAADKNIAGTEVDASVNAPGVGERSALWHDFIDITGDGRPDIIYKKNNQLWVALNRPAESGKTTLGYPFINGQGLVPLQDSVFQNGPLSTHTATSRRLWYGTANRNTVDVWRQAIDVNGDGRIDIIDAGEEPDHWVIYLNTPDPGGGIKWVRRPISVHNLGLELASLGHAIRGLYLPLSRRTTGVSVNVSVCVVSNGHTWVPGYDGEIPIETGPNYPNPPYTTFVYHCDHGNPTNSPDPPPTQHCLQDGMCEPQAGIEPERTFVEWELTDLNGDGFPDFVFNSSPADFSAAALPAPSGSAGQGNVLKVANVFQLRPGNQVRAAFNIVGVRIDINEPNAFARSVSLGAPHPDRGVSLWEGSDQPNPDGSTLQRETAGLADINGDGLVDRVVGNIAYLGVYTSHAGVARGFSNVVVRIPDTRGADGLAYPGFLSEQISTKEVQCMAGDKFTSELIAGFRDVNGDGIPDYYAHGRIALGTGAGFATPVDTADFQLSHQTESCSGDKSYTDGGLFDLDGDGIPEMIRLVVNSNGQRALSVTPVFTPMDRLTIVDNGYGAQTHIRYVSAKMFTDNPVPFPEIVVDSVSTAGTLTLGGSLAGSRYAYGNGDLVFDSAQDRFAFSGYRRFVEIRLTGNTDDRNVGAATITDTWPLMPLNTPLLFHSPPSKADRWKRAQLLGRPRDIYTLRGSDNQDPWLLLNVYAGDPSVIGVTHFDWDGKLFEAPVDANANARDCVEMVDPYDFPASFSAGLGPNGLNACRAHGFAFSTATESWYGGAPPPSDNNIRTRTRTLRVDDYGRAIVTAYDNDIFRSDDDLCVENSFAEPISTGSRVLHALATRRVFLGGKNCRENLAFASESFIYDGLPPGRVSAGHMTSLTVDQRATDNGTLMHSIKVFDATYDAAGNLAALRTQRGGATRATTIGYDPFGLVPTHVRIDATGVPSTESSVDYDPISLQAVLSTDVHQVKAGTEFDRFGRPILSTLTLPAGVLGVVARTGYLGFQGADPQGRRITTTRFADAVPLANVANTEGRTGTVFLDELGRERRTELALGGDYANESLVVQSRTYDGAGRIDFEADAYPKSQDPSTAYGASYYFRNTGELDCIIRGRGKQPRSTLTDVATELFPTCFTHTFAGNRSVVEVRDPASLQIGSPQAGVVHRVETSAIGRVVERATWQGGNRLEFETIGHDQLGQQTSVVRYLDPATALQGVRFSFRLDSLGQVLEVQEPETATRFNTYSDWGELVESRWTDGAVDRRMARKYDALGRLIESEESNDGVSDPRTVNKFAYDVAVSATPRVTPTFVLGRLARASAPSGDASFSYDAAGRVNAQVFTDPQAAIYIQRVDHQDDGRLRLLELQLPDDNYASETVKYGYDSAAQLRSINYNDASGSRALYNAETIDVFGRIRKARYGENTVFRANYAEGGRRLIEEAAVESAMGARRLMFDRFDPLGRELMRRERRDGAANDLKTNTSYDALGRLAFAVQSDGPLELSNWAFRYDMLGNILSLNDTLGTAGAAITYGDVDRDRICRIDYGNNAPGVSCNVVHDVLGRVVNEPTRTGSRQFEYFSSGHVLSITQGTTHANFAYGPLGGVQELSVLGGTSEQRSEHRFGRLIERHDAVSGGAGAPFVTRNIPGPGGIVASRRGAGGEWVFEFGELRGNRFFTNQDGAFVQEVGYRPFGEAQSSVATSSAANYTSYQWNGGDSLAAFGVSQLGARLYDPVIGRFLSRDPLLVPRTAATSSPYAFAMNDPSNNADPSGLECHGEAGEMCAPVALLVPRIPFGSIFGDAGGQFASPVQAPTVSSGPQTRASPNPVAFDTVAHDSSEEGDALVQDEVVESLQGLANASGFGFAANELWMSKALSGERFERLNPGLGSRNKWGGAAASLLEVGADAYLVSRDPSPYNKAILLLDISKPIAEKMGSYGMSWSIGVSWGEANFEAHEAFYHKLFEPFYSGNEFATGGYGEGLINRLTRTIDRLEVCSLTSPCGEEVFGGADRFTNHQLWERQNLPSFLWGIGLGVPTVCEEETYGQCEVDDE